MKIKCVLLLCSVLFLSCAKIPRVDELYINQTWGLNSNECSDNTTFRIGSGMHDITGTPVGRIMMGYAKPDQITKGIHMRLRSRAFVMESKCNGNRIVFVSADLGMIFQAEKQKVVEKLRAKFGGMYTAENVMLSATHTHSGPGGYSHYFLYNAVVLGFDERNFDTIVEGIYQSIVKAHNNLADGTIRIASDPLKGVSWNRSLKAYAKNWDAQNYASNTDELMTVLKFEQLDGKEAGVISWFPVHVTSIANTNHLISSDNKGYASYRFEKLKGTDYAADDTFVAAFAQGHEGDVTPNPIGDRPSDFPTSDDHFERAKWSGRKQFEKALKLYKDAEELLTGGVNFRHSYVDFSKVEVDAEWLKRENPKYKNEQSVKTCPAAIGISMLAGAEDGRGPSFISEGWNWANLPSDWGSILKQLQLVVKTKQCQGEKPIVLEMGVPKLSWTPQILPIQIATIGQLAIVAVPSEFTTMAGRRLIKDTGEQLAAAGVRYVIIAGLSNAYAGYVTTNEEYQAQHYEGASTHFGPWTLAAYRQEFSKLASLLRDGKSAPIGPLPFDLTDLQKVKFASETPLDSTHLRPFGRVIKDVKGTYRRGETVRVTFQAGHPNHDFKIQLTYLEVQAKKGSEWVAIAHDWAAETEFRWRDGTATIEWRIPTDLQTGIYRIQHHGYSKLQSRTIQPYTGTSREFDIVD